jgi:hypothetical protein
MEQNRFNGLEEKVFSFGLVGGFCIAVVGVAVSPFMVFAGLLVASVSPLFAIFHYYRRVKA